MCKNLRSDDLRSTSDNSHYVNCIEIIEYFGSANCHKQSGENADVMITGTYENEVHPLIPKMGTGDGEGARLDIIGPDSEIVQ